MFIFFYVLFFKFLLLVLNSFIFVDLLKKCSKPSLSKSHSSNSEEKAIVNPILLKKESSTTSSIKKIKSTCQKPLNTVDWEDDSTLLNQKEKQISNSELKTPEHNAKGSDELKSVSTEKEHPVFNQGSNILNRTEENSKMSLSNEISEAKRNEESACKDFKCSLEEDFLRVRDEKSGNDSMDIQDENDKNFETCLKKSFSNNNENVSPKSYKLSLDSQNDQIFNPVNFGNDLEMKIIKNMLNETNQKSRFSFVHSDEKKPKDNADNSFKEILLSSLKMTDFKRSSSLNFNDSLEKEQNEKKTSCYSHITEGENVSAKISNIYLNNEQNQKESFFMFNNDKNEITYEFNEDYYKKH